jgi:hypothetical protein
MVLGRWELCEAIQFNSWTAVQGWYWRVAGGAFLELRDDYLEPFDRRGEKSPPGSWQIKEFFVRSAEELNQRVDERVAELEAGVARPSPNKEGCKLRDCGCDGCVFVPADQGLLVLSCRGDQGSLRALHR